MKEEELYHGREQTLIKHFILRKYLERFAHIVGTFSDSITYVDCFSGPWNVRSENLEDSSFSIALQELRKARETLRDQDKTLKIRCMFLEKAAEPYACLEEFAAQVNDAEIRTINDELAGGVTEIVQFVRKGRGTFPFFFIDPTGWTGFEMDVIAPLLQQRPGEVLINFMTDYIRRFIDHPDEQTRQQFGALFGSANVKTRVQSAVGVADREDILVRSYADNVRTRGGFPYACVAIILYPEIDRSYFHLIYATRSRKGVEVFKDVEQRAMEVQEGTRANVKQRRRVARSRQPELFAGEDLPHSRPIDALRSRYLQEARNRVLELLRSKGSVPYEQAWDAALAFPLVWDCDVKEWIKDWQAQGAIAIEGMKPRQRVPKLDESNVLRWRTT
jgi:three-Cys-motif partner protein